MKKLIALVLVAILVMGGTCLAAEWPAGCSAAKPYTKLDEVNLNKTMGYIMLYPRLKLPVSQFCDVLEMYLPREDLVRGFGMLHLYENVAGSSEGEEVCSVDFSNPDSVEFRKLSEKEMSDLMWGSGMCVEIHLPKSLEFGNRLHSYYVLMDEGCFAASGGSVKSIAISKPEAWNPVINGDYGISGLYYLDAPYVEKALGTPEPEMLPNEGINNSSAIVNDGYAPQIAGDGYTPEISGDGYTPEIVGDGYAPEISGDGYTPEIVGDGYAPEIDGAPANVGTAAAAPQVNEAPQVNAVPQVTAAPAAPQVVGPASYVVKPDAGDIVHFDLVMGGDAVVAIPYSENGSVEFEIVEFNRSCHVTGTVIKDEVKWGIVFLNDMGDVIRAFELGH